MTDLDFSLLFPGIFI
uniref:Uncharacterized protein n=1 Tax=Anguilla anguilla TaxID=7936 RepID=A0A0E9W4G9_ANGAN